MNVNDPERQTCTCDRQAIAPDGSRTAHKPDCAWLQHSRMLAEADEDNRRFDGRTGLINRNPRGHRH